MSSNVYTKFERTLDEGLDDFLKESEISRTESPGLAAVLDRQATKSDFAEPRVTYVRGKTEVPHFANRLVVFKRAVQTVLPLMIADVVSLVCSGLLAYLFLRVLGVSEVRQLATIAPWVLLPLMVVYAFAGFYTEIWIHPILELRSLAHFNTLCLICTGIGFRNSQPYNWFVLAAWPMVFFLVPLARSVTRHIMARFGGWGFPTLVIGSGEDANKMADSLKNHPRTGLRPVLVSDPGNECQMSTISVINDSQQLASVIRTESIRHAVVSLPKCSSEQLTDLLDHYGAMLPHVILLCDAPDMPTLWGASRRCGRLTGIEVRNGLLLTTLNLVKRALDLVVSFAALTLGSWFFAMLYLTVRMTSKGPAFFGHKRIGQHGAQFRAWKFRSMFTNADVLLADYLAAHPEAREEWERDHKLKNDPRVTWIGNYLRKLSFDELPQLLNVFLGEMSLVGPRPIVEKEIEKYGNVFKQYMSVKPGITGLWQVSGRNDVRYDQRVQLDLFYVRHWSPWMDLYILGRTVITLICGKGAY